MRIKTKRRYRDYFLIDDVHGLLYLVNLGTIPLLVWPSRASDLDHPDWCVIDIDRGEASFDDVREVASVVHELLDDIDVPHMAKTTGGTGLHVVIPLGAALSYDQTRLFGELIAKTIAAEMPTLVTTELRPERRGARVFLDYFCNARGRLLVVPYSARPNPGAPVSTPLSWDELENLDPAQFTIKTVVPRVRELGDLWETLYDQGADVAAAIARLERR